jgi:hypothetical protein
MKSITAKEIYEQCVAMNYCHKWNIHGNPYDPNEYDFRLFPTFMRVGMGLTSREEYLAQRDLPIIKVSRIDKGFFFTRYKYYLELDNGELIDDPDNYGKLIYNRCK